MLTLTGTQINQINALLRAVKAQSSTSHHPDWPIWLVSSKLFERITKLETQLKNQDAKIANLENQVATLDSTIQNVARNAAVRRTAVL